MSRPETPRISRRTATAATLGLPFLAAANRVSAQEASPNASPESGEWSFTDVLGKTTTLPARPVRIATSINTAASLNDFGILPVAVFGWAASNFPEGDHIAWGSIDPATVELVGNTDGNVDVEALIVSQPDLIVTWIWNRDDPGTSMVGLPAEITEALESVAPVIVLNQGDTNDVELSRVMDLAAALGADLESESLVADQQEYESKLTEMAEITAARPELTVLFASYNPDEFFVASPDHVGDVGFARSLGLSLANNDSPDATVYWEPISQEEAVKYPSDVVYVDAFGAWTTLEQLQDHPTLSQHPAIAAGQIGLWNRELPLSFAGQARFIDDLLQLLRVAEKVS